MHQNTQKVITKSVGAPAIMLGLASPTSLGVIRSLGRHGVQVVGIGDSTFSLSAYSKYCDGVETAGSEAERLDLLLEIGAIASVRPVIFFENDEDLLFVEHHKEKLDDYFLWLPSLNSPLSELINKRSMLAFGQEAGLDVPITFFSDQHSLEKIQGSIFYPCIVKALFTQNDYKTKCEIAENSRQLAEITRERRFSSGYMVQEIIRGSVENLFFYIGYYDKYSKPLASVTGHKIRQVPDDFGVGTIAVSRYNKKIEELSEKFLSHIGFHGFADIEYKYDPKKDKYIFIEINPRPCGLIELASSAAPDMAYLAYQEMTTGLPGREKTKQQDGIFWMSILDDLVSCLKFPPAANKYVIFDWLRKIFLCKSYAVFSCTDPKPFFAELFFRIWKVVRRGF